jgi:hypothetical protein
MGDVPDGKMGRVRGFTSFTEKQLSTDSILTIERTASPPGCSP